MSSTVSDTQSTKIQLTVQLALLVESCTSHGEQVAEVSETPVAGRMVPLHLLVAGTEPGQANTPVPCPEAGWDRFGVQSVSAVSRAVRTAWLVGAKGCAQGSHLSARWPRIDRWCTWTGRTSKSLLLLPGYCSLCCAQPAGAGGSSTVRTGEEWSTRAGLGG